MSKSEITVTMPIEEYEKLKDIEKDHQSIIKMLERANDSGTAVLTTELRRYIEDIYC